MFDYMQMIQGIAGNSGSIATGAYNYWLSQKQKDEINELEKNNVRPVMDVPDSEKKALASAEAQSKLTRLPGHSAIEGRLDSVTANKIAMMERMGGGGPGSINAASHAYGDQLDKETTLGVEAAKNWYHNQGILRNEYHSIAPWEAKAWDWNTGQPYLTKQRAIAALKGAQLANETSAAYNLIGGFSGAAGNEKGGEYGGQKTQTKNQSDPYSSSYDWWNQQPTQTDGNGNYYKPTPDDTSAPMYGQEQPNPNYTDKMMNSGMGFFN